MENQNRLAVGGKSLARGLEMASQNLFFTTPTAPRLLPVNVSDAGQQLGAAAADATMASAPILCNTYVPSGSIHIQFSKAQVRVEGCADASALRVVLECLLR